MLKILTYETKSIQKSMTLRYPIRQLYYREIIQIIGLDEKMFYEDKSSKLVHQEYEKDQQIAQEMMVETNPSLVIFDNLNQQYGVILHQNINADIIEHVCENLHHDIGVCPKKTQRHQTCCVIKMVH